MHILIILFGIVCIIVALYLILNTNDKESNIYKDILKKHQEIVDYTNILDDIVDNLESLLEQKTETNLENKKSNSNNNNTVIMNNNSDENPEFKVKYEEIKKLDEEKNRYKKEDELSVENQIYELYKQGLNSNEIAKKLKKGIREIDIILKLIKFKEI